MKQSVKEWLERGACGGATSCPSLSEVTGNWDAVRCHFEEDERPALVHLRVVREEVVLV